MRLPVVLAVLGLVATVTTAEAAAITLQAEMKAVVEPASNTVFALGGDVDPANGPDAAKVTEDRWRQGLLAAQALKVAGADLNGAQKKPGADWTAAAQDFAKYAVDLEKAATTRDGAGFSTAANAMADTCSACHAKYKPQTGD